MSVFDSDNIPLVTRIEAGTNISVGYNVNSEGEGVYTVNTTGNAGFDSDQILSIIEENPQSSVTDGMSLDLGTPSDGSLSVENTVVSLSSTDKVTNSIDDLNEAMFNVLNNTAVANLSFSSNVTSGGAGFTATLTTTATGNPNRYDIYWGDGSVDSDSTDSTPSHQYSSNVGSPFTVRVDARNSGGSGAGSSSTSTRSDYIVVYTATPGMSFQVYRAATGGSALSGNDLWVKEGDSLYLDNNTTNVSPANATFHVNWGDGTAHDSDIQDSDAGGSLASASRLQHTWAQGTSSSTGRDTVSLHLTKHSSADPADIPRSTSISLKVYDDAPSTPDGLSTKTISSPSSTGSSPKLVSGYTDNTGGSTYSAGDTVNRITTTGAVSSSTISTYSYDADAGTLTALVNGDSDGSVEFTSGADETGTYTSLVVTDEEDYQLLNSGGSSTSFANSIYYPGLYKGFKARVTKNGSALTKGVNSYQLQHSTTGSTNTVEFVKDDLTTTPTIANSGSLAQNVAGTFRYVSGVPYYNSGSPSLTLSGVTVNNLTGQTYTDQSNIVEVDPGTNFESTSQSSISGQNFSYSQIDGSTTMLSSSIPIQDVGVGSAYAIGNLTIPITTSSVRTVETIKVRARNVNGVGSYSSDISTKLQVHTASQSGVREDATSVSSSLGQTYSDNAVRIFDFSAYGDSDNPSFDGSTNFYTNSTYSESSDPGVSGTQEATVRLGVLKHDTTDYSSGFLPAGPDRSGDTGSQYYTFAFRRSAVANFNINITSSTGIGGMWIALPGSSIDSTSTINGWLDCGIQYNGAGKPGANTGAGGNGSNGVASTGGDVIGSGSLSGAYTMTLGTENMTNATGNVVIVRIKLDSGDSVTSLSIT